MRHGTLRGCWLCVSHFLRKVMPSGGADGTTALFLLSLLERDTVEFWVWISRISDPGNMPGTLVG